MALSMVGVTPSAKSGTGPRTQPGPETMRGHADGVARPGRMEGARRRPTGWAFVLLLLAITAPTQPLSASESDLLPALRAGGRVLVFTATEAPDRTAAASRSSSSDCRAPRNLSHSAQQSAKALGDGFRNQEIDFDQVVSSPDCRSRHTAFLAIGADWVRYDERLAPDCDRRAPGFERALHNWLQSEPEAGRNHLLFVQSCALRNHATIGALPCVQGLRPGDAVVFHGTRALGCLGHGHWQAWAARPHWSERLDPDSSFPFRRPGP